MYSKLVFVLCINIYACRKVVSPGVEKCPVKMISSSVMGKSQSCRAKTHFAMRTKSLEQNRDMSIKVFVEKKDIVPYPPEKKHNTFMCVIHIFIVYRVQNHFQLARIHFDFVGS